MTKRELWEKAKMLPLLPGVYIIRDKTGEIIYIGKAKRLRTRVSQYFREGVPHDAKVTKMIQNAFQLCRARNGGDRMQCVPPAALQQKIPPGYRQRPSLPERAHRPMHGRV